MTYVEAKDRAHNGAKVRLPDWNDESYAIYDSGELLAVTRRGAACVIRDEERHRSDWQIVGCANHD